MSWVCTCWTFTMKQNSCKCQEKISADRKEARVSAFLWRPTWFVNKSSRQGRKAAFMDYRKGEPMERVCFDLAGPFPVSGCANKYALVVSYCFTKHVEIYPIPNFRSCDQHKCLPGNSSHGIAYCWNYIQTRVLNLRADYSRKCASHLEFIRLTWRLLDAKWRPKWKEYQDTN